MRFWLGVLAGAGAVWAALAIWQRMPELGPNDDIDPASVPGVAPWSPSEEVDPKDVPLRSDMGGRWRGDCTGFGGGSRPELIPAPRPYDSKRHEGMYP